MAVAITVHCRWYQPHHHRIVAVRVTAIIAAGRIAFAFTTITVALIAIAVVTIIFAFVFLVAFLSLIIIGTAVSRLGDFGMFAFPGRIEDAVVGLVSIFRVTDQISLLS